MSSGCEGDSRRLPSAGSKARAATRKTARSSQQRSKAMPARVALPACAVLIKCTLGRGGVFD